MKLHEQADKSNKLVNTGNVRGGRYEKIQQKRCQALQRTEEYVLNEKGKGMSHCNYNFLARNKLERE